MSESKCSNCGSSNIDIDPTRGDAICMECGFVLEDSIIVSQTTFEESPSGKVMALGHFVANDSSGGATTFGAPYANGRESRRITLQNARKGITQLCLQLRLNQENIESSVRYYKLALNLHLTRGRKQVHNQAACVYITCRVAGTEHLLIDISDVLNICVHELGRTYLRFSQAFNINLPTIDPTLYVLRFAHKLEFGEKTRDVSNTATRIVQRMKTDNIQIGRRPSGLCGAALLIAARLHEFNRSPNDIVKIVKVHESTLRKRLMEFGDTPASALTLENFMKLNLEAEEDPPAFKAARKKDKERLQKLENIDTEISALQAEINKQLEDCKLGKLKKRKRNDVLSEVTEVETEDADRFVRESNLSIIQRYVENDVDDPDEESQDAIINKNNNSYITGLGPDIAAMMFSNDHSNDYKEKADNNLEDKTVEDIHTSDIDDEELDSYILSEKETQYKSALWNKVNADYLVQQKEKEEKRLKEKEEGKPEKKRRRTTSRKNKTPANTVDEAIEKMLQQKKISTKINYEVLKSLNNQQRNSQELHTTNTISQLDDATNLNKSSPVKSTEVSLKKKHYSVRSSTQQSKMIDEEFTKHSQRDVKSIDIGEPIEDTSEIVFENCCLDEEESDAAEMSLGQMLESHAISETEFCDDDYQYD